MNTTTNSQHLLVNLDVSRTASVSVDPTSASYLADGESIVVAEDGRTIPEGAAGTGSITTTPKIRIATRNGDKLTWSPVLDGNKLRSYKGATYSAAVEQITYVGYNGTDQSIDVINSNVYLMRIIRQDTQATFLNKEMLKFATYKSDSSAAQYEIALGLAASGIANFKREAEKEIVFEVVLNAAATSTALGGLGNVTGNLTLVNGSKIVTMTDTQDLTVGDFIRFTGAATETLTDAAYRIASVDSSTQITLSHEFEGDSASSYDDDNAHLVPKATAEASDFGVRMTGQARDFTAGSFKYSKVRFEVTLAEDFGSTVVTKDTAAEEGVGMYEQVAELDWFLSQGQGGKVERIGTPSPVHTAQTGVVSGDGYGWIEIACDNVSHVGVAGGAVSKVEVKIACSGGTAGTAFGTGVTDTTNGIAKVLDEWASAFGGFAVSGLA